MTGIMQTVFDSENIQIKRYVLRKAMLNPDDTDVEKALVAMDDQKAWDVESRLKRFCLS